MGVALVSLDVSGGGTYISLTPFHLGEAGSNGDQTNNNKVSRLCIQSSGPSVRVNKRSNHPENYCSSTWALIFVGRHLINTILTCLERC